MFNPLSDATEFRPALAQRKKKFKKPEDDIEKLTPLTLDTMLLMDFWDYCVYKFPTPNFALVRSWLTRSFQDVDLCLRAIENVSCNPSRFENAEHAYRTASAQINRAIEKRRRAEGQEAA